MQKICTNKLHTKISHSVEDGMNAIVKHLNYSVNVALEVCEDCDISKIKQKLICKVAEEKDLKPGEIIYIDISSQKKPSYGGSNN